MAEKSSKRARLSDGLQVHPVLLPLEAEIIAMAPSEVLSAPLIPNRPTLIRLPESTDYIQLWLEGPVELFLAGLNGSLKATEEAVKLITFDGEGIIRVRMPHPGADKLYALARSNCRVSSGPWEPSQGKEEVSFYSQPVELLQEAFAEASILQLENFLPASRLAPIKETLGGAQRHPLGPIDWRRFDLLETPQTLPTALPEFTIDSFGFLQWLCTITGLELGPPKAPAHLWALHRRSYWLLSGRHPEAMAEGLDLYLCLQGRRRDDEEDQAPGEILYVEQEAGEVVGRIRPIGGALSVAYRTEGARRFLRYLPQSGSEGAEEPIIYLTVTYPLK